MAVVAPMPRAMVRIASSGEARRPGKHAQRVARVLQKILHQRQPLFRVIVFPYGLHRAKLQHRLAARLGGRHACAEILLRLPRQMLLHLFPQPLVVLPPGGEVLETRQKPPQESHDKSSALTSKNRAMIAAVCSQSRVSVSQLLSSRPCQAIETRPAVVLRCAPLGRNRALMLQLEQDGIQSALVDGQKISADLLDPPRDPIAMLWPQHIQRFQDHQPQRALQYICFLFHCFALLVSHR